MQEMQQFGEAFAKGFSNWIAIVWLIGYCLSFGLTFILNYFNVNVDDSDKSGKERSGLKVHTDYKTGIQYLSDGKGGMCVRGQK
jgi:hypothetical protein